MEKSDPASCVRCGQPPVVAPRLHVRQEHALDASVLHRLALCEAHAAELREGALTPQQIIHAWATREHGDLYRNERLVLRPEMRCLACNARLAADDDPAAGSDDEARCAQCGALNALGSALGHRVAVRVAAPAH